MIIDKLHMLNELKRRLIMDRVFFLFCFFVFNNEPKEEKKKEQYCTTKLRNDKREGETHQDITMSKHHKDEEK